MVSDAPVLWVLEGLNPLHTQDSETWVCLPPPVHYVPTVELEPLVQDTRSADRLQKIRVLCLNPLAESRVEHGPEKDPAGLSQAWPEGPGVITEKVSPRVYLLQTSVPGSWLQLLEVVTSQGTVPGATSGQGHLGISFSWD
ncbi:Hypothetical predicted protein [Marmota monax]|uniref:Uncharacterized protein n=1 Tax=Marmota monax TaxID=9995 RepID=A0A5E4D9G4_MARMO|nr:Hypothetical predicted protein [Marmota monax]